MNEINNYKKHEKRLLDEISINSRPTLVLVRAEWSGGSHLMDLIINKIEEEYKKHIKIIRIDLEIHKELLSHFGIESAPAILLINKGQIIEIIQQTLSRKSLEKIVIELIFGNGYLIKENKIH